MRKTKTLPISWEFYSLLAKNKCEFEINNQRKISWPDFTRKITLTSDNINDPRFIPKKKNDKQIFY